MNKFVATNPLPEGPFGDPRRTDDHAIELIALRVVERWGNNPTWRHREMYRYIRSRFEMCHDLAQRVLVQARLILQERAADPAIADRVVEAYWRIFDGHHEVYEQARKTGKLNIARLALNSKRDTLVALARHMGIGAPVRVELTNASGTTVVPERFAKLSTEELNVLAKLDLQPKTIEAQDTTAPQLTESTNGG